MPNKTKVIFLLVTFLPLVITITCLVLFFWCQFSTKSCPNGRGYTLLGCGIAFFAFGGVILEYIVFQVTHMTLSTKREQLSTSIDSDAKPIHVGLPILYNPYYDITAFGLERLHPFDSTKYRKVYHGLVESGVMTRQDIFAPDPVTYSQLLSIHTVKYLLSLHYSLSICRILELPICFLPASIIRWRVLLPMLYQTGGTLAAVEMAMHKGWSINLGGGFHHASRCQGGGFCVYADITLGLKRVTLGYPNRVKRMMIIDLDAHQGNGHERDFAEESEVFIFDAYNPSIYPMDYVAKKYISSEMHTKRSMSDHLYLSILKSELKSSLALFQPDFILYNAGTDCMMGDPLGQMNLSKEAIIARDAIVFGIALQNDPPIPITMVLSGGYQQTNAACISESILNLIRKFDLLQHNKEQNNTYQ